MDRNVHSTTLVAARVEDTYQAFLDCGFWNGCDSGYRGRCWYGDVDYRYDCDCDDDVVDDPGPYVEEDFVFVMS